MLFQNRNKNAFFGSRRRSSKIRNQADEILIYDVIGEDPFFGGGVSSKSVVEALKEIESDTVHVRINSPGGDVFEGEAIYNALRRHDARIETHIDGLAASAASLVAMAGDHVTMSDIASLMIHKTWGLAIGNATEMRSFADVLEKLDGSTAKAYAGKTGKTTNRIMQLMEAETWFDSKEAKTHRFVDEITEETGAQNAIDEAIQGLTRLATIMQAAGVPVYHNIPEQFQGSMQDAGPPTRRQLEQAMQDAGLSRGKARDLLSRYEEIVTQDADEGTQDAALIPLAERLAQTIRT